MYDLYADLRQRLGYEFSVDILTVRPATDDEIRLGNLHREMIARVEATRANWVEASAGCPTCGERESDELIWQDDETVRCANCGTIYQPPE